MKAACCKARRTATVERQWGAKIKSFLNTLVTVDLIYPDLPLKQFFVTVTLGVVGLFLPRKPSQLLLPRTALFARSAAA
jgi:hypothetical protein